MLTAFLKGTQPTYFQEAHMKGQRAAYGLRAAVGPPLPHWNRRTLNLAGL